MLASQGDEQEFQHYSPTIELSASPFHFKKKGIVVLHFSLDRAVEIFVLTTLWNGFMCFSNTPLTEEHPRTTNTYQTIQWTLYLHFITGYISSHIHAFWSLSISTDSAPRKHHNTELLRPTGTLEDIAINLIVTVLNTPPAINTLHSSPSGV